MKHYFPLFLLVPVLVVGYVQCASPRQHESNEATDEGAALAAAAGGRSGAAAGTVSLERKPLDRIRVGTIIRKGTAPEGWSHLVMIAVPTLVGEDERNAPKIAARYAQMFKFTILADVVGQGGAGKPPFYLAKVARGFATEVKGQERIVSGDNTLGAKLGLFGRRILEENETHLDEDVRQVVRTPTMLIFDAKAVMRRNDEHVHMIMRHAIMADPSTGRLYTLVWLLNNDYEPAEKAMQLLPEGMWEKRLLSVKRDKFTAGIPTKEAFALRQVPPGTAVSYTPELKEAATVKKFDEAGVPKIEDTLRAAAIRAAGK